MASPTALLENVKIQRINFRYSKTDICFKKFKDNTYIITD